MTRDWLTVCVLGLMLAGCGGRVGTPSGPSMPTGPAPRVVHGAPPAAYIEFGRPGRWMSQGSYCWMTGNSEACADGIPPDQRSDLPVLIVRRGTVGHIHLGFDPSSAELTIGGRTIKISPGRTIGFTATRSGVLTIFLNHGHDEAEYDARIVCR